MKSKNFNAICVICGTPFFHISSLQKVCRNYQCAIEYNRRKDESIKIKQEIKNLKKSNDSTAFNTKKLNSWSKENNDAQRAFNLYIRTRDDGLNCCSCGIEICSTKNPNAMQCDASHYRSRGASSHLRFNVFNVVSCCIDCNRIKSGNIVKLRSGLIERFGEEIVSRLESDNEIRRFDINYLKRIKRIFLKKTEIIKKIRNIKET